QLQLRCSGSTGAAAVVGQRRQDFCAVPRRFDFAEAEDSAEFRERARLQPAEVVEGGIVQHDEGRDALLLGRGAAPLAEEVAQGGVHRRGRRRGGHGQWLLALGCAAVGSAGQGTRLGSGFAGRRRSPCRRSRGPGRSSYALWPDRFREPGKARAADVARAAGIPLRIFAEMGADLEVAADARFREPDNVAIAVPGAVLFFAVLDFLDEVGEEAEIALLPEQNAVGGQAVAAREAG